MPKPATADQISRSIEPGSLESGNRQVVSDQMQQIVGPGSQQAAPQPGAAGGRAMDRLGQGGVSEKPITDGLSVGPGAGPVNIPQIAQSPRVDQLRIVAKNARSPRLRALARALLRVEAKKA